jgi:hypothetical protein
MLLSRYIVYDGVSEGCRTCKNKLFARLPTMFLLIALALPPQVFTMTHCVKPMQTHPPSCAVFDENVRFVWLQLIQGCQEQAYDAIEYVQRGDATAA